MSGSARPTRFRASSSTDFRGPWCRHMPSMRCSDIPGRRRPSPLIVILVAVADEAIVERLSRRRLCASCGITQSVSEDSEPQADPCPYCGGSLVRRDDDAPSTIRRRLATYASFAEPITTLYRARPRFASVDGLRHADEVTAALCCPYRAFQWRRFRAARPVTPANSTRSGRGGVSGLGLDRPEARAILPAVRWTTAILLEIRVKRRTEPLRLASSAERDRLSI